MVPQMPSRIAQEILLGARPTVTLDDLEQAGKLLVKQTGEIRHIAAELTERWLDKELRRAEQDANWVEHEAHTKTRAALVDLSRMVERLMSLVQIDQDVLDGFGTKFEAAITVVAGEINSLLQQVAAAGVQLPQANIDGINQALTDLTDLETPTSTTPVTTPPVSTPPVDTSPPVTTTPPADGSGTTPTDGGSTPPADSGSTDPVTTPPSPGDGTSTAPTVTPPADGTDTSGTPPA